MFLKKIFDPIEQQLLLTGIAGQKIVKALKR
jgi:hypothetical protein